MSHIPAFFVSVEALQHDPALQPGQRGARKLIVTQLYRTECEATNPIWQANAQSCPVQLMPDTEMAVFTQQAAQDRHYHQIATEIYFALAGTVLIEVKGRLYSLKAGDMLVVNPGVVHEVKPAGAEFLCRVLTMQCRGSADKFIVPPGVMEPP